LWQKITGLQVVHSKRCVCRPGKAAKPWSLGSKFALI